MESVRVEGFPAPDAKMMMEAMVRANGTRRRMRRGRSGLTVNPLVVKVYQMLQELVGDV